MTNIATMTITMTITTTNMVIRIRILARMVCSFSGIHIRMGRV